MGTMSSSADNRSSSSTTSTTSASLSVPSSTALRCASRYSVRRTDHGTHSGATSAPSSGRSSASTTVGSSPSMVASATVQSQPGYPARPHVNCSTVMPSGSVCVATRGPTASMGAKSASADSAKARCASVAKGGVVELGIEFFCHAAQHGRNLFTVRGVGVVPVLQL